MHVTPSRLLADHAGETPGIPGFGRLQTPKKLPCVTQATVPFTRRRETLSKAPSAVVIRDNEQWRETAPNPPKIAESPQLKDVPVTLRGVH